MQDHYSSYSSPANSSETSLLVEFWDYSGEQELTTIPEMNTVPSATSWITNINFPYNNRYNLFYRMAPNGRFLNSTSYKPMVAQLTGFFEAQQSGQYTFFLYSDDGARLYLDGDVIINEANPGIMSDPPGQATIDLTQGLHRLKLEYFDNGNGNGLILKYQDPSMLQKEVVPSELFVYDDGDGSENVLPIAYPSIEHAHYYENSTIFVEGSASYDPDGSSTDLTYHWSRIDEAPIDIQLSDVNSPTIAFTVSEVVSDTVLIFELIVNDGLDNSEPRIVKVPVLNIEPSVADFIAGPITRSISMPVFFEDRSVGLVSSYSWDFGDGGTSVNPYPSHAYAKAGMYTVTLTVDGLGGQDTITRTNYITITDNTELPTELPNAAFIANPLSGTAPLTVTFTDNSSGDIVKWDWDFGDGITQTYVVSKTNITHIYTTTGSYTVTLGVSEKNGQNDILLYDNYITVGRDDHSTIQPENIYLPLIVR